MYHIHPHAVRVVNRHRYRSKPVQIVEVNPAKVPARIRKAMVQRIREERRAAA